MGRILVCDNCGSEKLSGKKCPACHDLSDEEHALQKVCNEYVRGEIDVYKLEEQIGLILTDPKASQYFSPFDRPHIVYR